MQEIKNYIKERINAVNGFLDSFEDSSAIIEALHDDAFLYGTYEDAYDEDNTLSEDCYYITKFDFADYDYVHSYPMYQACLAERLDDSLSSDDLAEKLKTINGITNVVTSNEIKNLLIIQCKDSFKQSQDYKKFESLLNFFNYYIAKERFDDIYGMQMTLEARKPSKMNEYSLPYVYHITTRQRYEKIKKVGLCPKHHDRKSHHPSRIYVLSHEISDADLAKYSKMLYGDLDDVVILKIDTEGFKNHRCEINFYGDPQSNPKFKSMFTLESIPTNFITVYKQNSIL